MVTIEPTAAIAPSADHILFSRIGWPYQPADLARAFQKDRALFEWGGFYRTMADLPLVLPVMRAGPRSVATREWLAANDRFRGDVLAELRTEGPRRAAEIRDTAQVSWRSSGWTDNRNASQMLEILLSCGEVAVWGRDAKGRLFDLAERVYPPHVPELDAREASRLRAERRLGALGIARKKGVAQPVEPLDVGEIGVSARVDGVPGEWRVDETAMDAATSPFAGRTALLSPFDRLVFDRNRLSELFGFEYVLEMYKPAARRRWGYFALPILHGDRLIGKLDAKADRKAGVLRISGIHEDTPFDAATTDAVHREIRSLARWLGMPIDGLPGD